MSASVGKSTSNLYTIITTGGGEDTFLWNVNVFFHRRLLIVILQSTHAQHYGTHSKVLLAVLSIFK